MSFIQAVTAVMPTIAFAFLWITNLPVTFSLNLGAVPCGAEELLSPPTCTIFSSLLLNPQLLLKLLLGSNQLRGMGVGLELSKVGPRHQTPV